MTGGLRNAATSCGDGPDVATWVLERWLICDCCCTRSASSLSEEGTIVSCGRDCPVGSLAGGQKERPLSQAARQS